jgi:hypothetical protein
VSVAGGEVAPGITDTNNRFPVKVIIGITLVTQPGTMYETHFTGFAKPI